MRPHTHLISATRSNRSAAGVAASLYGDLSRPRSAMSAADWRAPSFPNGVWERGAREADIISLGRDSGSRCGLRARRRCTLVLPIVSLATRKPVAYTPGLPRV